MNKLRVMEIIYSGLKEGLYDSHKIRLLNNIGLLSSTEWRINKLN